MQLHRINSLTQMCQTSGAMTPQSMCLGSFVSRDGVIITPKGSIKHSRRHPFCNPQDLMTSLRTGPPLRDYVDDAGQDSRETFPSLCCCPIGPGLVD